jgi:NAD(P)H-dependent FMN reductase
LVAAWVAEQAKKHGSFKVEVLDLGEINLPMMNEPHHPMQKRYTHEHTKNWSAKIDEAEAYIFVTAEDDFPYPAPLRNALEYLYLEWGYKPAAIVSYGGVSAGTRAAKNLMGDLPCFKMVPLTDMVNFPFFSKMINEQGEFIPPEVSEKAATTMLNELARWTKGLKPIREDASDAKN